MVPIVVPEPSGTHYGGEIWASNLFVNGFPCTPTRYSFKCCLDSPVLSPLLLPHLVHILFSLSLLFCYLPVFPNPLSIHPPFLFIVFP